MTGGRSGNFYYYSSTEQLVKGGTDWTETENSLPARVKYDIIHRYIKQFYFQEVTIGTNLITQTKYYCLMKRQQPSNRQENWNKEEMIIQ